MDKDKVSKLIELREELINHYGKKNLKDLENIGFLYFDKDYQNYDIKDKQVDEDIMKIENKIVENIK